MESARCVSKGKVLRVAAATWPRSVLKVVLQLATVVSFSSLGSKFNLLKHASNRVLCFRLQYLLYTVQIAGDDVCNFRAILPLKMFKNEALQNSSR